MHGKISPMFHSIALRHQKSRSTTGFKSVLILLLAVLLLSGCSSKTSSDLILATTTSTYDTGLLDKLAPAFTERYGQKIKVIAVGTGEALAMGERGEADVLLVHAPDSERAFMAAGHGQSRKPVMYNWFLLVGPQEDPAGAGSAGNIIAAFQAINETQSTFISRGDNSGTHKKELALWEAGSRKPQGSWYQEVGQGMGATLRIADEKQAYALTDEGTFRVQRKSLSLRAFKLKDRRLRNEYSVIVVTDNAGAHAFSRFLISRQGQSLIRGFRSPGHKKSLFTPDAK